VGPAPHSEGHSHTFVDWNPADKAVERALDAAKKGFRGQATEFLEQAYGAFADAAEQELIMVTGHDVKVQGLRGRAPVEVWSPLVEKTVTSKQLLSKEISSVLDNARALVDCALALRSFINVGIRYAKGPEYILDLLGKINVPKQDHLGLFLAKRNMTVVLKDILEIHVLYLCGNGTGIFDENSKESMEVIIKKLRDIEEAAAKLRKVEIVDNYKASLTQSKSASKRAYMASQLPQQWQPQTTTDPMTGTVTADPSKILGSERRKYGKLWNAKEKEASFGFTLP